MCQWKLPPKAAGKGWTLRAVPPALPGQAKAQWETAGQEECESGGDTNPQLGMPVSMLIWFVVQAAR